MKQRRTLLAAAVVLLVALLFTACDDTSQSEQPTGTADQPSPTATATDTAVPTPTPLASPSPTPTRTPRPTPTSTPAPTLTPTPLPSPLVGYAQQCGRLLFPFDSEQAIRDPNLYTWGILGQSIDEFVDGYSRLSPPPELARYHAANLNAWTTLRDAVVRRPGQDSFANDYDTLFKELFDELVRAGFDTTISDEELQNSFEEILAQKLRDFYGQDAYAADQTAQETLEALSKETREVLAGIECVPPLFGVDTDPEASAEERDALVAFYIATDGPNWSDNTNWLSDAPLRDWYGVTIGADGRVTYLILTRNQLSGMIPPEVGNLSSLELLDLQYNQLRGELPPELGNLASLKVLALRDNRLSGEIPPELGTLAALGVLNLGGNEISGKIPTELAKLTNLVNLSLGGNELTGEIPPELGTLTKLTFLALNNNDLTGAIPPELGNFTALRTLWLKNNRLTGEIPEELGTLTNLYSLTLIGNQLDGTCPPSALRSVPDFDRSGAFHFCP